ncbi:DMT family transporter [Brevundimonas sp. G8]|uniref:DMT family transporter n=1 Tax=Brevundimonas sp. G8 TaxID=1350776 RepID=UPI001F33FEE3|nr:DMT family transporter [Brevundimonas sp. G8]
MSAPAQRSLPRVSPRAFALIVLLIAACVLGLAPILVRLTETGPAAAGFWRFLFALPLLTILAAREPGGIATPSKWALLAGLFFALDLSFWHYGIVMTSVANATVLCNLTPVVVTLFGWFVLKDRPHRLFLVALALAMGGAFAMAAGADGGQGPIRRWATSSRCRWRSGIRAISWRCRRRGERPAPCASPSGPPCWARPCY